MKLVKEILAAREGKLRVLDPFSGTATTTLSAASHGHSACSCDINPFLVWLGNTKLASYAEEVLRKTAQLAESIEYGKEGVLPVTPPPISFIERWWDPDSLKYLCRIKAGIDNIDHIHGQSRDLLLIAFCRTLIELSNASFGHQSVSFHKKTKTTQRLFWNTTGIEGAFLENTRQVLSSAADNPAGMGQVMECDARHLSNLPDESFDLLITSPPYPNRMSYIRELRPYMFWLGYLKEAREAGEMDWQAIGGTWGIATSRLSDWIPLESSFFSPTLGESLTAIANTNAKSGPLLSNYVAKYFDDMWQHFRVVSRVMKPRSELHYVIGNSKFYQCMVHAEIIFAEMLRQTGFEDVEIKQLRKRNSKKELYEFDVIAHRQ
ncbi:MAG: DNA adenine methylase [Pirellulales bacterium]|nr:DNA adenine methylase [Pirellulales bacterium]